MGDFSQTGHGNRRYAPETPVATSMTRDQANSVPPPPTAIHPEAKAARSRQESEPTLEQQLTALAACSGAVANLATEIGNRTERVAENLAGAAPEKAAGSHEGKSAPRYGGDLIREVFRTLDEIQCGLCRTERALDRLGE